MTIKTVFSVGCALLCVFCVSQRLAVADDLAIVVNKKTAVLAITSRDLKSIYLGEKETWFNGVRVTAVGLGGDLPDSRAFFKVVCGMSPADFNKYFMQLSFQGKTVNRPKMMPSAATVKAAVAATPGAIGVLPMSAVDDTVNVIPLDGIVAGAAGYKLSAK